METHPLMTSFKPVGGCYVHPRSPKNSTKGQPARVQEIEGEPAVERATTKRFKIPVNELKALAKTGGTARSFSAALQMAYESEPFSKFPASGIVMVKDPLHPEQPFWPARILSYQDYLPLYQSIPHNDRPGKKDVGVILFSPAWSSQLMELRCVPATTACLAPYQGLMRMATGQANAEAPTSKLGNAGHERPSARATPCLFDGIDAAAAASPTLLDSTVTVNTEALRRTKRRLVAAHYVADALHRVAWRSGLGPCPPLPKSAEGKTKRLNPAYFQVAAFPDSIYTVEWSKFLDPGLGIKKLDSLLGLSDMDWEPEAAGLRSPLALEAETSLCARLLSRGKPSEVFDLYAIVDSPSQSLASTHPPERMGEDEVPYGADAWASTFVGNGSSSLAGDDCSRGWARVTLGEESVGNRSVAINKVGVFRDVNTPGSASVAEATAMDAHSSTVSDSDVAARRSEHLARWAARPFAKPCQQKPEALGTSAECPDTVASSHSNAPSHSVREVSLRVCGSRVVPPSGSGSDRKGGLGPAPSVTRICVGGVSEVPSPSFTAAGAVFAAAAVAVPSAKLNVDHTSAQTKESQHLKRRKDKDKGAAKKMAQRPSKKALTHSSVGASNEPVNTIIKPSSERTCSNSSILKHVLFQPPSRQQSPAQILPGAEVEPWWSKDPESLVGRRVSVLWNRKNNTFYNGIVKYFDTASRAHLVEFDDGDRRSYKLSRKTFKIQCDLSPSLSLSSAGATEWREYEFVNPGRESASRGVPRTPLPSAPKVATASTTFTALDTSTALSPTLDNIEVGSPAKSRTPSPAPGAPKSPAFFVAQEPRPPNEPHAATLLRLSSPSPAPQQQYKNKTDVPSPTNLPPPGPNLACAAHALTFSSSHQASNAPFDGPGASLCFPPSDSSTSHVSGTSQPQKAPLASFRLSTKLFPVTNSHPVPHPPQAPKAPSVAFSVSSHLKSSAPPPTPPNVLAPDTSSAPVSLPDPTAKAQHLACAAPTASSFPAGPTQQGATDTSSPPVPPSTPDRATPNAAASETARPDSPSVSTTGASSLLKPPPPQVLKAPNAAPGALARLVPPTDSTAGPSSLLIPTPPHEAPKASNVGPSATTLPIPPSDSTTVHRTSGTSSAPHSFPIPFAIAAQKELDTLKKLRAQSAPDSSTTPLTIAAQKKLDMLNGLNVTITQNREHAELVERLGKVRQEQQRRERELLDKQPQQPDPENQQQISAQIRQHSIEQFQSRCLTHQVQQLPDTLLYPYQQEGQQYPYQQERQQYPFFPHHGAQQPQYSWHTNMYPVDTPVVQGGQYFQQGYQIEQTFFHDRNRNNQTHFPISFRQDGQLLQKDSHQERTQPVSSAHTQKERPVEHPQPQRQPLTSFPLKRSLHQEDQSTTLSNQQETSSIAQLEKQTEPTNAKDSLPLKRPKHHEATVTKSHTEESWRQQEERLLELEKRCRAAEEEAQDLRVVNRRMSKVALDAHERLKEYQRVLRRYDDFLRVLGDSIGPPAQVARKLVTLCNHTKVLAEAVASTEHLEAHNATSVSSSSTTTSRAVDESINVRAVEETAGAHEVATTTVIRTEELGSPAQLGSLAELVRESMGQVEGLSMKRGEYTLTGALMLSTWLSAVQKKATLLRVAWESLSSSSSKDLFSSSATSSSCSSSSSLSATLSGSASASSETPKTSQNNHETSCNNRHEPRNGTETKIAVGEFHSLSSSQSASSAPPETSRPNPDNSIRGESIGNTSVLSPQQVMQQRHCDPCANSVSADTLAEVTPVSYNSRPSNTATHPGLSNVTTPRIVVRDSGECAPEALDSGFQPGDETSSPFARNGANTRQNSNASCSPPAGACERDKVEHESESNARSVVEIARDITEVDLESRSKPSSVGGSTASPNDVAFPKFISGPDGVKVNDQELAIHEQGANFEVYDNNEDKNGIKEQVKQKVPCLDSSDAGTSNFLLGGKTFDGETVSSDRMSGPSTSRKRPSENSGSKTTGKHTTAMRYSIGSEIAEDECQNRNNAIRDPGRNCNESDDHQSLPTTKPSPDHRSSSSSDALGGFSALLPSAPREQTLSGPAHRSFEFNLPIGKIVLTPDGRERCLL